MSGAIKSLLVEKQHIVLVGTVVYMQQLIQSVGLDINVLPEGTTKDIPHSRAEAVLNRPFLHRAGHS